MRRFWRGRGGARRGGFGREREVEGVLDGGRVKALARVPRVGHFRVQ